MTIAGLVAVNGDKFNHRSAQAPASGSEASTAQGGDLVDEAPASEDEDATEAEPEDEIEPPVSTKGSPRAVFNVNVSLDSSLDTDKLERQLKLLKRFGAI
jgi:hypothetical protein